MQKYDEYVVKTTLMLKAAQGCNCLVNIQYR